MRRVPLRNDAGEITGVVTVARDLSERRQAEQLQARLAALVDASEDSIIGIDTRGLVRSWNPGSERLYGYSAAEMIGHPLTRLVPPDRPAELPALMERLGRLRQGERVEPFESERLCKDGSRVQVSVVASPIVDPSGNAVGASVIARDITARKRAERERDELFRDLTETNERLALANKRTQELAEEAQHRALELDAVISTEAEGVVIYGRNGEIVRLNPAAEQILGLTPERQRMSIEERAAIVDTETAGGRPMAPEETPSWRALRGETVRGEVMVLRQPSGQSRWISTSAAPLFSPEGEAEGAVAVFTDITELCELQERQTDYLRLVSHDLRTPLGVVMGYAAMLRNRIEKRGDDQELRYARSIVASVHRMNAMIQDLVDVTRLESGQLVLERQPLELKPFVSQLLEQYAPVMDVGRIEIDFPEGLSPVQPTPTGWSAF